MKKTLIFLISLTLGLMCFPNPSFALTVSPAKFVLSADPGETLETEMTIRNDLERYLTFYPVFERFTTRGDEPIFIAEKTDLASWIETSPSEVTLGYKQTAQISIKIKVPEDAEPGGHYAVIFWSSASPDNGKGEGVSIVTRVGALILLDVSGNAIESGEIDRFGAEKTLFSRKPISFSYTLKNTGTVHLEPEGQLVIKNIFGRTVAILAVNPTDSNVLPKTERAVSTANFEPEGGFPKIEGEGFFSELKREKEGFALGYYRANLNLEYGKKEIKTLKASFGFWVFPWRLITVFLLVLGILLFGITKGIRTYNRWIISKVRESFNEKKKG